MATKRELIEAIAGRYHAATRIEKKKILDEFIKVTGFHQKQAIRALKRHTGNGSEPAPRARIYDEVAVAALTILWEAAGHVRGRLDILQRADGAHAARWSVNATGVEFDDAVFIGETP